MVNLIILDRSFEYERKPESAQAIISAVIEIVHKNNLVFSHFVVDGFEVYENHEHYLLENIDSITRVVVESKTKKEWLNEMVVSATKYLERGIPTLEQLANEFYQGSNGDSWLGFEQMLEGLQWLSQLIYEMDQNRTIYPGFEKIEEFVLQDVLLDLEQAVKNQDMILLADILSYEVLPRYNSIHQQLVEILNDGVVDSGAN